MSDGVSIGEGTATAATAKALLVKCEDLGDEIWIPLSVITDDSEVWEVGQSGDVVVAEWWATKEGHV